jgi:2-oxoglutarate ferredoxin oxidoreductase subunit beta
MAETLTVDPTPEVKLTAKDFQTDQDVRWCPGCGDYSILKQVHTILPQLGLKQEDIVFISGIGCSSRFPYYTETFGMHSIHGRATAVASGLKASRPELSVWIVTGDGDGLSIGGNHTIHLMRRNFDVNILLFNNEIYGLTKGQYSPTSPEGKVAKSTPYGSIDHPFNPIALALGADATFVARSMDRDPAHLQQMLLRSYKHKGASFLEIYQNCNIYNDGAFELFTEKSTKKANDLFMVHGQPLVFGETDEKGIRLDGFTPQVVNFSDGFSKEDMMIHDEKDVNKAMILSRLFDIHNAEVKFPKPFGIFYTTERSTYEDDMKMQLEFAVGKLGAGDLNKMLRGSETWVVQ